MRKRDSLLLTARQQSLSDCLNGRAPHLLAKSLLQYYSNSFDLQLVQIRQNF